MYQTVFNLKQETPIIHFLHDQPGATLRATELKPKLDRLILAELGRSAIRQEWISSDGANGHISLDYKISIRPTGKSYPVKLDSEPKLDRETGKDKYETRAYPHLLANMGGKDYQEDLKNLVLYDGVELVIRTWHDELQTHLKRFLPILLLKTNFGNRGSKGFGSFSCIAIDGQPFRGRPGYRYCFDWRMRGNNVGEQHKNLFNAINFFYKCLRSGINQVNKSQQTEFYFKSLMYAYANAQNQKWDKYTIKNFFFTGGQLPAEKADYRDWLGLSTEEMWGRRYNGQKVTKDSPDIERFASPIFFKPISVREGQYKVYIGVQAGGEEMDGFRNATIDVHVKGKQKLTLHPARQFDIHGFLRFALEETDIEEHLFQYDRDNINDTNYHLYRDIIHPIFSSIHQNLPQEA
ncbi:MAG: hypothetical protein U0U46_17955 [Saprospiraceae bacterium]